MKGQLFVISAPSGTGKSTVLREVRKGLNGVGYSISHTTRRPRPGEKDGSDYHFVKRDHFHQMVGKGSFVEWARVYGDLYGTSFAGLKSQMESGVDVLLDLDTQGARAIRERFHDSVLIFLVPPSLETLEQRLRARHTDGKEIIETRLKKASEEIARFSGYDYVVINDELAQAVKEVKGIILAERCRTARRAVAVNELFRRVFS